MAAVCNLLNNSDIIDMLNYNDLIEEMSSSAVKKTVLSNSDIQLPVYRKLPPIQTPPMMQGRQVMSPSMVTVDFSPNGIATKHVADSQNSPARKSPSTSLKPTNQNSASRSNNQLASSKKPGASKPLAKGNGDVALSNSPKGIELIGFKFNKDNAGAVTGVSSDTKPDANGWTPLSTELPPCKICGDKASGLHYGVNTCEACKAFFRRTLKKTSVDFMCSCSKEEKKLGTDVARKFTCAKCRYERCINVGMSKDAIKIGRYTITRKRQNDKEVKSLKSGHGSSDGRKLSESSSKSSSSLSPYSTGQSVSSPEELSSDITSLSLQSSMKTQKARKRRHDVDNDPEDGFLYRSLTNSIILSILENQQTTSKISSPEAFPVEMVMSYIGAPTDELDEQPSAMEQLLTDETSVNQEQTSLEKLLSSEFSAPEFQEGTEEQSVNQLLASTAPTDILLDQSPIEKLLMDGDANFEDIPIKSFDLVPDRSPDILGRADVQLNYHIGHNSGEGQQAMIPIKADLNEGHYSTVDSDYPSVHAMKESPIESLLKGNGVEPSQVQHSPIETLFMTPVSLNSQSEHADLNHLTSSINMTHPLKQEVVYDPMSQIDNVKCSSFPDDEHVVLYGVNAGTPHNTKAENCEDNVLIASKLDQSLNEPFEVACDYIKQDLEGDIFTADNKEDLEIQMQQFSRFENPSLVVGQGISLEQAHQIVVSLLMAASVLFVTPKLTCEEIKKRHSEYLEQYTLKKQVFGNMSNVSKEEYLDFYNQTGIEIDNRQQILIESLKYIEDSISKLVKFSKSIPGFAELHIDDQVNLVKVSRLEFQIIKLQRTGVCMKSVGQITTTPWNKEYHMEEISRIYPIVFLESKMKICREFNKLSLTEAESVILRGIIVTFPASRFEQGMIQFGRLGKCVQSSLNIATLPWNKEYHFDEISKIFPVDYCSTKIGQVADVLELGLTFQETVLMKSIILTFPDRCVLKEPQKVEKIHDQLIACFLHLLSKRPSEKTLSIQTIMKILFRLRDLAAWDTQIVQELFEVWPASSNHQLAKEVVS